MTEERYICPATRQAALVAQGRRLQEALEEVLPEVDNLRCRPGENIQKV